MVGGPCFQICSKHLHDLYFQYIILKSGMLKLSETGTGNGVLITIISDNVNLNNANLNASNAYPPVA